MNFPFSVVSPFSPCFESSRVGNICTCSWLCVGKYTHLPPETLCAVEGGKGRKKGRKKIESNPSFSSYADIRDLFRTSGLKPVAMTGNLIKTFQLSCVSCVRARMAIFIPQNEMDKMLLSSQRNQITSSYEIRPHDGLLRLTVHVSSFCSSRRCSRKP